MGSHARRYLPLGRGDIPAFIPAIKVGTRFSDPEGSSWLVVILVIGHETNMLQHGAELITG